jgi:hypothetical protein
MLVTMSVRMKHIFILQKGLIEVLLGPSCFELALWLTLPHPESVCLCSQALRILERVYFLSL